jgi:hypothetical protein
MRMICLEHGQLRYLCSVIVVQSLPSYRCLALERSKTPQANREREALKPWSYAGKCLRL